MAIISFWESKNEEIGKSSALVAIATYLGINHNYKILVIDTKFNDYFYQDCFRNKNRTINLIRNGSSKAGIGEGIEGLSRAILSNKISPEIITNYTKIVFNENRLELLYDVNTNNEQYETHKKLFNEIAKIADKFYDLVFIDIDKSLDKNTQNVLLENSDLIITCLTQRIRSIDDYIKQKSENELLKKKIFFPVVCRFDKTSKYNEKNMTRYIKEKRGMGIVPYNTLFMESSNEGKIADFFIKFRKLKDKDKNAIFVDDVKNTSEKMLERLKEAQMRM